MLSDLTFFDCCGLPFGRLRSKGTADLPEFSHLRISLEDDFRVFAKRLQREVYGMAHRRKPNKFSLMLLPSLEGSMFSPEGRRTLHYHVAIGNVPADMSADKLRKTIWDQWAKSAYGQMDIKFKPANEGWLSYITKEMEHGNTRCCDWGNTFVPECALRP